MLTSGGKWAVLPKVGIAWLVSGPKSLDLTFNGLKKRIKKLRKKGEKKGKKIGDGGKEDTFRGRGTVEEGRSQAEL